MRAIFPFYSLFALLTALPSQLRFPADHSSATLAPPCLYFHFLHVFKLALKKRLLEWFSWCLGNRGQPCFRSSGCDWLTSYKIHSSDFKRSSATFDKRLTSKGKEGLEAEFVLASHLPRSVLVSEPGPSLESSLP